MRLTRYTDYSLRVLLYLGYRGGEPATISDIAKFYRISRNHLVKVVHHLGQNGFVQTARGKRGGIRLAKAPALISIGDVVRKTEPDFTLLECFDPAADHCAITRICRLKGVLFDARAAFMAELDRYTLADVGAIPQPAGDVPAAIRLLRDKSRAETPVRRG